MAAGERLQHSGNAPETTLNGAINSSVTSITVTDGTGYPDGSVGPFWIVIDPGLAAEEKVKCVSRTGNSITVVTTPSSGRGADSTTATSHVSGAVVQHIMSADELDKLNQHINDQNDNHTTYLTTGRHDVTARHAVGTSIGAGTPGASAPNDVAAAGVSTNAARADHTHERELFSTGVTTSAPGDAAGGGASTAVSRGDHRHGRESYGSPAAVGTSLADGGSASIARSNHVHSAPQHTRLLGRTDALVGTAPAAGTGPWLTQVGTSTPTLNGSGNATISFPTAFPGGVVTVVGNSGDASASDAAVSMATFTTSGFDVHFEGHGAGPVRLNWIAVGW